MPTTNDGSRHGTRYGSSWGRRAGLRVLVCAVTAGAVYLAGLNKAGRSERYSATATIHQQLPGCDAPSTDGPAATPAPDAIDISKQIVSEENLRRVLDELIPQPNGATRGHVSAETSETIEQVRQNLRAGLAKSSAGDQLQISIGYTGEDPDRVVRLVNGLAEQYAGDRRRSLEATARQSYHHARQAAETARQQFLAAGSRLEEFLQRHFQEHQSPAAAMSTLRPPPAPSAEPGLPMIDNPHWVELDHQREELARHRAELLVERTPLHPEVRDVELRIAQLEQRLEGMPRQIPNRQSHRPDPSRPPLDGPKTEPPPVDSPSASTYPVLPGPTPQEQTEAAQSFLVLKQQADQAQQEYQRLAQVERQAWQRQLQVPNIQVLPAQRCEVSRRSGHSARLILAALASGLALAIGAGMISTGLGGDRPYNTLAEAQAGLPLAIVGAVPAADHAEGSDSTHPRRDGGGPATVISGVIVIAICITILLVYMTYSL